METSERKEVKLKKYQMYEIIHSLKERNNKINIKLFLNILNLSSSGYYSFLKVKDKKKSKEEKEFSLIKRIYDKHGGRIGYRRIAMKLNWNHKKVYRLMRKNNLTSIIRKKRKANILSNKLLKSNKASNILNRAFKQSTPYRFLSTDITYLKYHKENNRAFLSVIKDMASGEILVYHLSKKMDLDLVSKTLDKLERYFKKEKINSNFNILLHSDQGFQYTHSFYKKKLKELKIIQSMSRKGNSVDNAIIETFFGHLKDEINFKDINSFTELSGIIKNYMIYFNHQRPQWHKKKMTPIQFKYYLFELLKNGEKREEKK